MKAYDKSLQERRELWDVCKIYGEGEHLLDEIKVSMEIRSELSDSFRKSVGSETGMF